MEPLQFGLATKQVSSSWRVSANEQALSAEPHKRPLLSQLQKSFSHNAVDIQPKLYRYLVSSASRTWLWLCESVPASDPRRVLIAFGAGAEPVGHRPLRCHIHGIQTQVMRCLPACCFILSVTIQRLAPRAVKLGAHGVVTECCEGLSLLPH